MPRSPSAVRAARTRAGSCSPAATMISAPALSSASVAVRGAARDTTTVSGDSGAAVTSAESKWIPLFNGRNLHGWTIKIAKRPLGENYANTFRVEDGLLLRGGVEAHWESPSVVVWSVAHGHGRSYSP